jgi:hypothetical protein
MSLEGVKHKNPTTTVQHKAIQKKKFLSTNQFFV